MNRADYNRNRRIGENTIAGSPTLKTSFELLATVAENRQVAQQTYRLSLDAPDIARIARPGQFLHIDCGTRIVTHRACDPAEARAALPERFGPGARIFLRRPFSIYRIDGTQVQIVHRVIGAGTRALSRLTRGDRLQLLGPLGNVFDLPAHHERAVLVAGGIGLPPLLFLAEALAKASVRSVLLYGVHHAEQIIQSAVEAFERQCDAVQLVLEEPAEGRQTGRVTDRLEAVLQPGDVLYAVGPRGMLQAVSTIALNAGNRCSLLMEERMACGIGVCLSCMQMTRDGYKRMCVEGPVFAAREVLWE